MYLVFDRWCQECGTGDLVKAFYEYNKAKKFVDDHNNRASKRELAKYEIVEIIPD